MADYKELKGQGISSRSADPSNPVLGQMWYNAPAFSVKVLTQAEKKKLKNGRKRSIDIITLLAFIN